MPDEIMDAIDRRDVSKLKHNLDKITEAHINRIVDILSGKNPKAKLYGGEALGLNDILETLARDKPNLFSETLIKKIKILMAEHGELVGVIVFLEKLDDKDVEDIIDKAGWGLEWLSGNFSHSFDSKAISHLINKVAEKSDDIMLNQALRHLMDNILDKFKIEHVKLLCNKMNEKNKKNLRGKLDYLFDNLQRDKKRDLIKRFTNDQVINFLKDKKEYTALSSLDSPKVKKVFQDDKKIIEKAIKDENDDLLLNLSQYYPELLADYKDELMKLVDKGNFGYVLHNLLVWSRQQGKDLGFTKDEINDINNECEKRSHIFFG